MKTHGLIAAILLAWTTGAAATALEFTPYEFKAANGTVVEAQQGTFTVPERRSDPASRRLKLTFVRFAATGARKGPPIVYLAGGPGGSGIAAARGPRFPLFMAMREFGDVIAFDQRGTGASNDIVKCEPKRELPLDRPLTREAATAFMTETAQECAALWRKAGVDLAGYTTEESAADIDELRELLGARKVTLWGISYGTHLALAILKRYPQRIEKAVLSSLEGLDETVKLPANTDAFFGRLQQAIDADPSVAKVYPDLAGTMRRVLEKLDQHPVTVPVKDSAGGDVQLTLGKFDLQLMTAASISDPRFSATLPRLYAQMDSGDFSEAGKRVYNFMRRPGAMGFGAMELVMDIASGISPQQARVVADQARSALLGDTLNFPMPHLAGTLGIPDLGESFRSPVKSAVPVLFLSGTLDGRTYPESAARIAAGFKHATRLTAVNGGHNLFEASPAIQDAIVAYMRTGKLPSASVVLPPPQFPH